MRCASDVWCRTSCVVRRWGYVNFGILLWYSIYQSRLNGLMELPCLQTNCSAITSLVLGWPCEHKGHHPNVLDPRCSMTPNKAGILEQDSLFLLGPFHAIDIKETLNHIVLLQSPRFPSPVNQLSKMGCYPSTLTRPLQTTWGGIFVDPYFSISRDEFELALTINSKHRMVTPTKFGRPAVEDRKRRENPEREPQVYPPVPAHLRGSPGPSLLRNKVTFSAESVAGGVGVAK